MSAYSHLAGWYDALTGDVPYDEFADYYEKIFRACGESVSTILDVACGTGTLTCLLALRGYETIAVDASEEMLAVAAEKAGDLNGCTPPLLLCQKMTGLDLYGTVDAAVCSLDGMNYLPDHELPEVFRRLGLFIASGGILIFDVHSPERLRSLSGQVFVDETDDLLCLWRADFDQGENALVYSMDIFQREGSLWHREFEEHIEYSHDISMLTDMLASAGFTNIIVRTDGPQNELGRVFISAINRRD